MNDRQITQLSLSLENISFDEEISDEELRLVSNAANSQSADLSEMKKNWRKVTGDLIDTSKNDNGFSLSWDALKFMTDHFKKTKKTKYLHQFFEDHKYWTVGAKMGRQISLEAKRQGNGGKVRYVGLLDKRHPRTDRADAFPGVSATIAHGDQTCSSCNTKLADPAHDTYLNSRDHPDNWHPVSNKAIHIETSFVTFPAYKSTSVEMMSSLMSDAIKEAIPDIDPPEPPEHPLIGEDGEEEDDEDSEEETPSDADKEAELEAQQHAAETKELTGLLEELQEVRKLRKEYSELRASQNT